MHAKVPHSQVDLVLRHHLHQRVLAEVQRPLRRQLHPVASRQHLARHLDHVLLLLHLAAQHSNVEAGQHPRVRAHIRPHHHIAAVCGATRASPAARVRLPPRPVRVHRQGSPAPHHPRVVPQAHIDRRRIDMQLHRRLHPLQLLNLVRRRARVDRQFHNVVPCRPVQFALRLHQRNQLRRAVKIIQRQHAVLLRQPQVWRNLRRPRRAVGLLLQ